MRVVLADRAQVVPVGDEGAVATVHRGAVTGGDGQGVDVDAVVVDRRGARGHVREHQERVGQALVGLTPVVGDPGQPGPEVEETAYEGEAEAEQAAGDQVGQLVVLVGPRPRSPACSGRTDGSRSSGTHVTTAWTGSRG